MSHLLPILVLRTFLHISTPQSGVRDPVDPFHRRPTDWNLLSVVWYPLAVSPPVTGIAPRLDVTLFLCVSAGVQTRDVGWGMGIFRL